MEVNRLLDHLTTGSTNKLFHIHQSRNIKHQQKITVCGKNPLMAPKPITKYGNMRILLMINSHMQSLVHSNIMKMFLQKTYQKPILEDPYYKFHRFFLTTKGDLHYIA